MSARDAADTGLATQNQSRADSLRAVVPARGDALRRLSSTPPRDSAPAALDPRELQARIATLERDLDRERSRTAETERLGRIGIWDLEPRGGVLSWSDGTYRIFGLSPDQPIGLARAFACYPTEWQPQVRRAVVAAIDRGLPFDHVVQFNRADGSPGWVRSVGRCETGDDGLRHVFGFVQDVTQEVSNEQRLLSLASRDALTGAYNRRAFVDRMGLALQAARSGASFALVLLDVDHFKEVNDVHGHAAGDQLLRELARRLCSGVRPEDTVARFGGDEFAMILAGVADEMTVRRRLAEIVELFATPVELSTGPLDIAISLGAALYPAGGETADELLHSADIALYQAKSFGRRQACVFHPGLGDEIEARLGLLSDARAGLARGQFEVFYQPIVDLRTADVRALEALVRWHHPTRGLLTPAAFPPVLADPALAWEIGDFVIARSLRQLRKWLDAGAPACCIQVNVSASQLRRGDELVGRIMSLLRECGLTPDRLRLELLEGAFVGRQAEAVAHTLKLLKSEGVVIALDDFGTGYASLTHIKQFDVGRIKIDRSFIAGVCNAASDAAITRAIIDLGRNLNIRVTAEGVEEPAQLAFLMAAGCDCGQGYLFGRPMPAADLPAWLAEWCGGRGAAILAGGLAATATRLAI